MYIYFFADDINFAPQLSDFRNRKKIHVILIHRGFAHKSLLMCADDIYNFSTFTEDLPERSYDVAKHPCQLQITNLPLNENGSLIKEHLRKAFYNFGGKVLSVNQGKAFIRFADTTSAERAKKRMDKEIILGNIVCVNFKPETDPALSVTSSRFEVESKMKSYVANSASSICKSPLSPPPTGFQKEFALEPYCEKHFHMSDYDYWNKHYSTFHLPSVFMPLKDVSHAIHMLLGTHYGSLPLISFCDCYEAEIGLLPVVGSYENLSTMAGYLDAEPIISEVSKDQKGVPLEHLIACVTGVEVANSLHSIKKVQWIENRLADSQILQNCSPALARQLNLFGREVMDLLKSQPQCLVAFNEFIPSYHHYFGRVIPDYGFTKLIDLFEAIPHIVQVLGEGQDRQVTLAHRTQVKLFSAELLRMLKSRASKQITVSEFPHVYEQVIEKTFEITNYGVCEIEDMLEEVPENIIVICRSGTETIIGIPKTDQTAEEIERTKQFGAEVVELMKHAPHCTMSIKKFIPGYHNFFKKQCHVADYGCRKLVDLFKAVPDILKIEGDFITLTPEVIKGKCLNKELVAQNSSQHQDKPECSKRPLSNPGKHRSPPVKSRKISTSDVSIIQDPTMDHLKPGPHVISLDRISQRQSSSSSSESKNLKDSSLKSSEDLTQYRETLPAKKDKCPSSQSTPTRQRSPNTKPRK